MRTRRAAGAEGQVRGAGRCFLSPRCELIIQMGCPGFRDWRPAPARRAISPAAHVTAALVRSAVHTSSSSSSFTPPCNAPLSLAAPAPCQPCRSCQENLGKRFGQASFLSMPGARGLLLRAQGRITGASTHYTERGERNKLLYAYSTPGFTSHLNSSPLILTEPER